MQVAGHIFWVVLLTALTQVGGIAWAVSRFLKRKNFWFLAIYLLMSVGSIWVAPMFGRVPLSCLGDGSPRVLSPIYCALNRQYVSPEMKAVLTDLSDAMPESRVAVLDGNFPFLDGFPLLPHLSHDDGDKVDLAFFYLDAEGRYQPMKARSPLGYFAFEQGPTECPKRWLDLRWDFEWAQSWLRPVWQLDKGRMISALTILNEDVRVGKVLLEPHLKAQLVPHAEKIRFQCCRAAGHDDHIHLQL